MKLVKTRRNRTCKKCDNIIWKNAYYYPCRRGKAICFNCGKTPRIKTFLNKLLKWLGKHGE